MPGACLERLPGCVHAAGCPGLEAAVLGLLSLPCWVLWDRHLGAQDELEDSFCVTEWEKSV